MKLRVVSSKREITDLNRNEQLVHLAFFLATHNYDAVPRGNHVDLNLNGKVYQLYPNGDAPGLCNIKS